MNYYERHLGDYARDAGHLTMLEHGAYTLLLDRYYTTEHGIPADQAHRVCRARTRDEKEAVDTVLAEFFTLADGMWTNGRAERELADYRASEPEREAKKANNRERQERSRERRRAIFEQLRGHGVVPAYDASMAELQADLSRISKQQRNAPVTRDGTATQSPDTNTNTPPPPKGGADPAGFAEFWNSWPASERKVARKQCAVKWLRKGFNAQLPAIVAHVEAMKQSKQWRDGFEPAPLTYLNQERCGDGLPSDAESTSEAGFI